MIFIRSMRVVAITISFLVISLSFAQEWIIARHGLSEHNIKKIFSSKDSTVSNLTEEGKQQVAASAEQLLAMGYTKEKIKLIFISRLRRTKQTAQVYCQQGVVPLSARVSPYLDELNWGTLEGKSYSEYPVQDLWDHSLVPQYGGEDDQMLERRVQSFIEYVRENRPSSTVMVVTHGGPAMQLFKLLAGVPKQQLPEGGFGIIKDGKVVYVSEGVSHDKLPDTEKNNK